MSEVSPSFKEVYELENEEGKGYSELEIKFNSWLNDGQLPDTASGTLPYV